MHFSPDNLFLSEETFLERYPGDEWVDMVGMDNYGDMGRDGYRPEVAAQKLKIVSDYAKKAGKLAAFTETGLESITNPTWWNETLLKVMRNSDMELVVCTGVAERHSKSHSLLCALSRPPERTRLYQVLQ
jgi:mannan endo-1,4-beta-mannosidase